MHGYPNDIAHPAKPTVCICSDSGGLCETRIKLVQERFLLKKDKPEPEHNSVVFINL